MRFRQATAVSSIEGSPGRHTAEILDGWDIGGNANGGYLLAIAARAMAEHVGRPDAATISAHYLSPGKPGAVTIDTTTVKEGRRFATATGSMTSAESGKPILQVLGAFTDLSQASGPELVDASPPDLPPVEDCIVMGQGDTGFAPSFFRSVDIRLHPADANFHIEPSGNARVRGWFRFFDDEPIDAIALTQVVDALPPTAFNLNLPIAWVPTVELTAHIRAIPVPGWLRCDFRTHFVTGGFLEEDGRIWDESGRMVAQSRQLALIPQQQP